MLYIHFDRWLFDNNNYMMIIQIEKYRLDRLNQDTIFTSIEI